MEPGERREGRKRERPVELQNPTDPQALLSGLGYSDQTNPFHDVQLSSSFSWKLKKQKLLDQGLDPGEISAEAEDRRRDELRREIDKLKSRRAQREEEKAAMELEKERLARERDMRAMTEFEKDEDSFLFTQLKTRALVRMKQGRPKSIDWLVLYYLHASKEWAAAERAVKDQRRNALQQAAGQEEEALPLLPHSSLSPLEILGLVWESAEADVRAPADSPNPRSAAAAALRREPPASETTGWNGLTKLRDDVKLFVDLEESTHHPGGVPGAEGFWEGCQALLDDLIAHRPPSKLPSQAALLLRDEPAPPAGSNSGQGDIASEMSAMFAGKDSAGLAELEANIKLMLDSGAAADEEFFHTALARLRLHKAKARLGEIFARLEAQAQAQREALPAGGADLDEPQIIFADLNPSAAGAGLTEDEMVKRESERGMDKDEEAFGDEALPTAHEAMYFSWQDKYRPRKPRFFNRVKSGFEWNKYNRTHYDGDNPPPKIIQGYKFNVFYPDLIDKKKTPRYILEKADSPDNVILRFSAGPPYEDIAFKIVNREWEYSHKRGFKCVFSNGILQLWFNFKRYGYRR